MTTLDRIDRHALVMTIWTPCVVIATILLARGVQTGGGWWLAAGVLAILAGFVGHLIANAVLATGFTAGEVAFACVAFSVALLALLATRLFGPEELADRIVLPGGLGLAALLLAVVVYMVIAFGPRGAFARFDVIRDNNPRAASRLPHRGGRR